MQLCGSAGAGCGVRLWLVRLHRLRPGILFDARLQASYQQAENGANGWVLETRAEDVYLKPTHADWHYEAIRYRIPWVHDALDKVLKRTQTCSAAPDGCALTTRRWWMQRT